MVLPNSPPPEASSSSATLESSSGKKGLFVFVLFAVVAVLLSRYTPLGSWLTMEQIRRVAEHLGVWGPLVIAAVGIFSPLIFLPRWPVAFVSGLLYGVFWGTALATVVSTLGAWLHFLQARTLLSTYSATLLRRSGFSGKELSPGRVFSIIFFLRAFPVSNFVATNLLAGALRMKMSNYLLATFFGMIPSTVMYAAWGKLMKKPDASVFYLAAGAVLLLLAGTAAARRYLRPWFSGRGQGSGSSGGGNEDQRSEN